MFKESSFPSEQNSEEETTRRDFLEKSG